MVRLTGRHPFNVEAPLPELWKRGFLTPASLHYVRNHGAAPSYGRRRAACPVAPPVRRRTLTSLGRTTAPRMHSDELHPTRTRTRTRTRTVTALTSTLSSDPNATQAPCPRSTGPSTASPSTAWCVRVRVRVRHGV
eukprot:scaffold82126_cov47-Phaeocystis_antarctica.AAC.1